MTTATATPPQLEAPPRNRGLGIALISAAAFGLSGSLGKSLLEIGWSPGAVVGFRITGAFVALLIPCLFLLRQTGLPSAANSRRLIAYGVIAVAGSQLCYFSAVQYLSVGVALLLEYLAPVLLIGWHWWRGGTRPSMAVLAGAGIAMVGMIFVLDLTSDVKINPIGIAWGLGAAACLCGYFILSENASGQAQVPPLLMTTIGTGVGAVVIGVAGLSGALPISFGGGTTELGGQSLPWWVPGTLLVLIATVAAYLTGIVAIRRLGSAVASFVALAEVIFAVIFAAVLLSQQPSLTQLLGGVLVIIGIATIQKLDR